MGTIAISVIDLERLPARARCMISVMNSWSTSKQRDARHLIGCLYLSLIAWVELWSKKPCGGGKDLGNTIIIYTVSTMPLPVSCFGTPHCGADPRGLVHRVAERVLRVAGFTVNDQLLDSLLPSSERLRELRDEFSRMSREKNWVLYSFQEQYGLKVLNGDKVGSSFTL